MFKSKAAVGQQNIDTLISHNTTIKGDLIFTGGIHIDGTVKGNIIADDVTSAFLTIGEHARIEGEIHVPEIIVNGTVIGDIFSSQKVELAANASITGNVYYNLIKMLIGARVNGNLVYKVTEPGKIEGKRTEKAHEETTIQLKTQSAV